MLKGDAFAPLEELGTVSEAEGCLIILNVVRGQKFVDFFELKNRLLDVDVYEWLDTPRQHL